MRNLVLAIALTVTSTATAAPALAAADPVSGTVNASFSDPQPGTGVSTGIGSDHVTWGTPLTGYKANELSFQSNTPFSALLGEQFKVGSISYYNGTILDGTELTGLTLNLGLNFTNPAIGLLAKSFALGLYSTPNTGSADANADYVYLPSLQSINNFVVDGQAYQFELRGFDNVRGDGYLNSSASEFHVREGQSATADVFGVLSAVPEPGTWAMMLIGFAMIGVAMRSRRRDMPAALV
ncbi:choice-of-anchor K domain-containing protein [Sphingomonas sp. RRHST34]|uniref:Choice-of-anchor K domain-containing protein n=1 Tax=Sphingomonas citri TaxID=2862499 RepID=A0ABS7BTE6_9SPHN|nr:choice-of-anchor K domain-containing protein [Sphingomonas citri]MBW6532846.1 choice-of-anchor K domain-containing protein [Sphingomonas citri]